MKVAEFTASFAFDMAGKGELVDRFFDVGDGVFAIAAQPAPRLADPNPIAAMMGMGKT